MGRQRHTAEQIISKLREAEALQAKGMSIEEAMRQLGISDATYYNYDRPHGAFEGNTP
jgi:putative transposase